VGMERLIERLRDLLKQIGKQKKQESAPTLRGTEVRLQKLQPPRNIDMTINASNVDLVTAYNTTLEGWSKALDLGDRETGGHTQRVAELTVRLARAMGVTDADLVHIRRGALLHDIGKMGVPDSILLKPAPLTDEEWVVMKKHPTNAYELLSSIPYLRPAADIAYCHHEKWNRVSTRAEGRTDPPGGPHLRRRERVGFASFRCPLPSSLVAGAHLGLHSRAVREEL
jgi:putative nucleotidyltransferase with HDIG domain